MTTRLLVSETPSPCHHRPSIIVQSRKGGFVTQNCGTCGVPRALRLWELPAVQCPRCGIDLDSGTNANRNYEYSCRQCRFRCQVAELVPRWHELFDRHGYAIESDQV